MKVSWDNVRTLEEEYDKLEEDLHKNNTFFSWEHHPNKLRMSNIMEVRIRAKMDKVMKQITEENY